MKQLRDSSAIQPREDVKAEVGSKNCCLFIATCRECSVDVVVRATDQQTTENSKQRDPGPAGCVRLFAWLLRRKLDQEIRLDVRILEGLADKNTSIEGMKLSRFDRVLGLNRERIQRIYRGKA